MTEEHDHPHRPRSGSTADLAARISRLETSAETQGGQITALNVAMGQLTTALDGLNRTVDSRYDAQKSEWEKVGNALAGMDRRLVKFMEDPEANAVGRERRERFEEWRDDVDKDRRNFMGFVTSARAITRVAMFVAGGSWLTTILALTALIMGDKP